MKDIKVYSVIDLALKYNDTLRIIDWKTGKKTDTNKIQLAVYSMYANKVWKYDIEKIKFYLCYLGEETKTEEEKIDLKTVKSVYNIILDSYAEMAELYHNGEPRIEEFSKTDSDFMCMTCKYREACVRAEAEEEQLKYFREHPIEDR